jgi:hypothetical protein
MCNKTSFDGENSLSATSDEASSLVIPETLEHPSTKPEKLLFTPIQPLCPNRRGEKTNSSPERVCDSGWKADVCDKTN